jgi:ABC-type Fe3+-hydroxamate transport system substrate-binding protein
MIKKVGEIVERQTRAYELTKQIVQQFNSVNKATTLLNAIYFIWRKPYMAAGKNTFINSMLQACGIANAITKERYPELTTVDLAATNPGIVLLSSEPYPFADKHIEEIQTILPQAKVLLVDGEMFSWYGSRLLQAPAYFNELLNKLK